MTLEQCPRLRATPLYAMIRDRGFAGSAVQVQRWVRTVRPAVRAEAYLRLETNSVPRDAHLQGTPCGVAIMLRPVQQRLGIAELAHVDLAEAVASSSRRRSFPSMGPQHHQEPITVVAEVLHALVEATRWPRRPR